MTKQEQANDMFFRFKTSVDISNEEAKICTFLTINLIIKALKYPPNPNENRQIVSIETLKYWEEMKKEVEKL